MLPEVNMDLTSVCKPLNAGEVLGAAQQTPIPFLSCSFFLLLPLTPSLCSGETSLRP